MPDPRLAGAGQAPSENRLCGLARYILEERERRRWHFPRAVFDEIPWEMLLLLFASEPEALPKAAMVNALLVAPEVIDRWIDYLEREGLLRKVRELDGAAVLQLTPHGLSSLELYLLDRLERAEAIGSQIKTGGGTGLPGWAVALLMLATAILSGATTWSLAAG